MIPHILFESLLFFSGALVVLACHPNIRAMWILPLSLPLGLGVWVLSTVVALFFNFQFAFEPVMLSGAIALLLSLFIASKRSSFRRVLTLSLTTFVFGLLLSSLFHWFSYAMFSGDSYRMILMSQTLGSSLTIYAAALLSELTNQGPLYLVAQAYPSIFGMDFSYSLQPLVLLSLVSLLGLGIYELTKDQKISTFYKVVVTIIFIAAFVTTPGPLLHGGYIHNNLISALYLFIAVISFLLASLHKESGWLAIASLGAIFFSLVRLESSFIAILTFMVFFSIENRELWREKFSRLKVYLPFFISVGGWLLFATAYTPAKTIGTPDRMLALLLLVVSYGVVELFFLSSYLSRFRRYLPLLAFFCLSLAVLLAYLVFPEEMYVSYRSFVGNILIKGWWGGFWWIFLPLLAILIFVKRNTIQRTLYMIVGLSLLYVFALGYFRAELGMPFRIGYGDSANRILVSLVPLLLLALSQYVLSDRSDEI